MTGGKHWHCNRKHGTASSVFSKTESPNDIIREEREKGAIIVIATHHKEALEELCDVVLKIDEGKIICETAL